MLEEKINTTQLTTDKLVNIIKKIQHVKVGVIGDGCLDVYWDADMRISQLSRETPHYPLPVVEERMYPGGGTNVAVNVSTLKANQTYMLTMIGKDWRGDSLKYELVNSGVNPQFISINKHRITPAYCKPMRKGYSDLIYEDPRIDFENHCPLTEQEEKDILDNLEQMADIVDVIAVCDQLEFGVITQKVRKALKGLGQQGKKIVVDSRTRAGLFQNVIIKPNEFEALTITKGQDIPEEIDDDIIIHTAHKLYEKNEAPVIITLGERGALWYEGESFYFMDAMPVKPPIDIVGAGDSFLAAFCCAYGAGFLGQEAVAFGNLVSSVAIQKLGMPGTATPEELIIQWEQTEK